ncbi:MAG: sugar ABC transporter substrate-binding protein [Treponema sp.]|nr:sugar ABC transporter substrate-binding protein [Treponema sp.]
MKKRLMIIGFALLAGAVILFVIGRRDRSVASSSGEDVDVVVNFYGHSDNEPILDKLIAEFNALNNGIKVVNHTIPNDDYDDKVKILVTGNSREMDVFWIRTPAQAQQYITNNALLDLAPYAAESGLDVTPIRNSSLKGASAPDGKFYGLPTTGSCWLLFYNKDLFDARGLPYPENITWDQYLDLAKQLTYTEGGKKYWGGVVPPWNMNLGAAAAGEYLTAPAPMEKTRQYAEVQYRMYTGDKSHPGIAEMSVGTFDVNAVFESGNVYMMIQGDWEFQLLKTPFTYGVAPLPVFPGTPPGSSVGQASYFSIPKSAPHPKEAYKFIEFCTASSAGATIYAQSKNIPSYPSDAALAVYKELVKVPGIEYRFSASIASEQGTEPYYASILDTFVQEIQLYLLGEKSLDRMFNDFLALRKEIIDNF